MFKIHEFSGPSGELSAVCLREREGALEIVSEGQAWALPRGALRAILTRFGAPFDPDAPSASVAAMTLTTGEVLRHVRHLAGYDVIARDYIVYEGPDTDALCAMATTVAAALMHLGRATARTGGRD